MIFYINFKNNRINGNHRRSNNLSGFTLIELMVATTLFTIIMLMGVGSLVVSSNLAKTAQKLRTAVDNVNFAMESITRELRTGTHYECETDVVNMASIGYSLDCATSGGNIIAFNPQVGSSSSRVAYKLTDARPDGTRGIERCEYTTYKTCSDIVSTNVNITTLKFYVRGSDNTAPNINVQSSVKILVKGVVTIKGVATPFILQSMASQRSTEN